MGKTAESAAGAPRGPATASIRRTSEAQILAAAETVFAQSGFDGATMTQLAATAGLPKANLHYYFGTKERLYCAVLERILALWLDDAVEWIVPDRHPAEGLAGYVRAKMAHSRRRPEASRIFAGELLRGAPHIMSYLRTDLRQRVTAMAGVIAGWSKAGLMDPVHPVHLLFAIWAMTQTYADFDAQIRAVLDKTKIGDAEFATATETVVALVLKGCGVRAPAMEP
ncbi:TetR family transcriptional regulator C-terminal domain-containing protein [Limobrevibacterium gyesilva]|uniref:TetR/AcrR family transcriptional regulator n=1 Tax=Limobrevibacterium gyesilva TaxID=2991712 RepID=A0AA41YLH9_9PROT|nr:TetR/AcrR family transcriptional regulator [Limobrevibacterium gyesilva]